MKHLSRLLALLLLLVPARFAGATANYVFHEQTNNFVATPTCPNGETDTLGGQYVENADRSPNAGFQIFAPETYTLRAKIEFQFYTNQARVYYTTDGSTPSGVLGVGSGTTHVVNADYTWTYQDQNQNCSVVDIITAEIPPQPAGTTVKYIVSAFNDGGGDEIFANSGTCQSCTPVTASSGATVFQYDSIAPNLVVTSTSDDGDGTCDAAGTGDGCTLREAMQVANGIPIGTPASGTPGGATITFAAGVTGTISLLEPLPDIITDMTIQGRGAGAITVARSSDANTPDFRIFKNADLTAGGSTVLISGLTLSNGKASGTSPDDRGGAVYNEHGNLTLQNCALRQNSAANGGAICNDGSATGAILTLIGCTLDANDAGTGLGGGLYNYGANSGNATATLQNCTLSFNTSGNGGAIFNDGLGGVASLTLANCTLSRNMAGSGNGGGVFSSGSSSGNATLAITSCTFAGNSAGTAGGLYDDGSNFGSAALTIGNTILADPNGNIASNFGTITDNGFNLISDDASALLPAATNIQNTQPLLGALADNGGPTLTHALLGNSPALDKGKSFGLTLDQRGQARTVDQPTIANASDGTDIGAYEKATLAFGTLAFNVAAYSVNENAGTATITVSRTSGSDGTVTVAYATSNGTATAGSDYTATSGTLTFGDGETSKTFTVAITDDSTHEADETINLTLSNVTGGATLGTQTTSVLTITDNDPAPVPGTLAFSAATYTVGENVATATITVSRTGGSDGAVTVNYATSNGTATAGSDYTSSSGTLSFGVGETTKTFTVAITNDTLAEADETINLTLSSPTGGASLGAQATATLTITDNDRALTVSVAPLLFAENAGANASHGTVSRTGPTTGALTVALASTDTTEATVPASVIIPAGATSARFTIAAVDDAIADGPQRLTISAVAAHYIPGKLTITVTDNEARLTLTTSVASFYENGGATAAIGKITRNTLTTAPLTVSLSSENKHKVLVSPNITIPAGASFVTFPIQAVDNSVADGTQRIKITARIKGFPTVTTIVAVLDDEAKLTLSIAPSTFSETIGNGVVKLTITRNTPTTDLLAVSLASSDARVRVPTSATIPVGAKSVTFGINVVNDSIKNANKPVVLTATATGYQSGTVPCTVTDNDR